MKRTVTIACLLPLLAAGVASAADFSAWQQKTKITFTGYNPPGGATPLTNFPALVVLSTNISGFRYGDFQSSVNQDLRFAAADGTDELNYEIEKWDTNGSSCVWIKVPNLVDSNTFVWAYWGKSGTNAPAYTTNGAVWDTNYAGVWHMTNTNPPNSVAGGVRGTKSNNVTLAAGQVGTALHFANTNTVDYVNVDGTGPQDPDVLTVTAWVKFDATSPNGGVIYGHRAEPTRLLQLGANATNDTRLQLRGSGNNLQSVVVTNDLRQWTHLAGVFDNMTDRHILYVNGQPRGSNTYHFGAETFTSTKQTIGTHNNGSYQNGVEGFIDEVRVSSAVRSANWIWAEWLNMASNSLFASADAVVGTAGIRTDAPTNVMSTAACLNGYLWSTGGSATTVLVYWGPADGGTNPAAWAHSDTLGVQTAGALSTSVTGLNANGVYYYRHEATNSAGVAWAPASVGFSTAAPRGPIFRFW